MNNDLEKMAVLLLRETIAHLRKKIRSGEATPSDIKNAIQLLKDNGVSCEVKNGAPLAELYAELPFSIEELQ